MKSQLVSKGTAAALVLASAVVTVPLLSDYIAVVTDSLNGAGEAQWQMAFLIAPFAAVPAMAAAAICRLSQPQLGPALTLAAATFAITPLVLSCLVMLGIY